MIPPDLERLAVRYIKERAAHMDSLDQARKAKEALRSLLNRPPWLRGVGLSQNPTGVPVVKVLVASLTDEVKAAIPSEIEGVSVVVVETGDFKPSS